MITLIDKKNAAKGPPPLPYSYTEFCIFQLNYQELLKVFVVNHCEHFTEVKNITQTVNTIFLQNKRIINKIKRANLILAIHCNARYLFGNIAISADLHNGTGPKESLEYTKYHYKM